MPQTVDGRLWVLVTDGCRARVMTASAEDGCFRTVLPLGTMDGAHCPPPLRNQTVDEARRGFVTDLAHRLDDEAAAHTYDSLVIVAPARVLHDVQQALGEARSHVVAAVERDGDYPDDAAMSPILAQWSHGVAGQA